MKTSTDVSHQNPNRSLKFYSDFCLLCRHSRRGHVKTTGASLDTAKVLKTGFTTTTLTVPCRPASSGKRTTITAESGRNTEAPRLRWNSKKLKF